MLGSFGIYYNGSPAAVSKVVTNDGSGGAPVYHPLDDVFKGELTSFLHLI